ncbi:MAG: sensor histidine kinase [Flavobacteriales bacterium]|nr:sensor histidine kinase [Flavobacteriales bacterium]
MLQSAIRNIVLTITLLWLSAIAIGQNTEQYKQLQLADSLGQTSHFVQAHTLTDSLLNVVAQQELDNPAFRLELLQLKAQFYEKQEENEKALKIALRVLKEAEKLGLHKVLCSVRLTLALIHEKNDDLKRTWQNLQEANRLIVAHDLEFQYAHYCIRTSSYYRLKSQVDSSIFYAEEALVSAVKLNQAWHRNDAHLLLGLLYSVKEQPLLAIKHLKKAATEYMLRNNMDHAGAMYHNVSTIYSEMDSLDKGFLYLDSAISVYTNGHLAAPYYFYETRSNLFKLNGELDSAYFYKQLQFVVYQKEVEAANTVEINRITAQFEGEKKQADLDNQLEVNKKQQRLLRQSAILISIIVLVLLLLFLAYRKLRSNNKQMNRHTQELKSSLEQKNVLLAEVQHRVKNNLQLIIALLDLQKEAPSDKSIAEITTESQRRIESMAFLHDNVYLSDNLEKVNLQAYLEEVSSLIQGSYEENEKTIEINVNSELETISIEQAIPLGLITVELLTNSYKYAFKEQKRGIINIQTGTTQTKPYSFSFIYKDNGVGYGGKLQNKGLGMEIIKGLVGQLHGKVEFKGENGFEAKILF